LSGFSLWLSETAGQKGAGILSPSPRKKRGKTSWGKIWMENETTIQGTSCDTIKQQRASLGHKSDPNGKRWGSVKNRHDILGVISLI